MYNNLTYSKFRDRQEKRKRRKAARRTFFKVMCLTVLLSTTLIIATAFLIFTVDRRTNYDRSVAIVAAPFMQDVYDTCDENIIEEYFTQDEIIPYVKVYKNLEKTYEEEYEPWKPYNYVPYPYHHDRVTITKISLGMFEITAYCLCVICCGIWSRYHPNNIDNPNFVQRTASGTIPVAGRTAAINLNVFYFGQEFYITGIGWRVAEDTGSAVTANVIDIFMNCHQEALRFGRRLREVFIWL